MSLGEYRGDTPEEDVHLGTYREDVIAEVAPSDEPGRWGVVTEQRWGCAVWSDTEPRPGDVLRTYGDFGRPFHGQALNGRLLWYRTREEQEAEHERRVAEKEREDRERFERVRPELDAKYDELPEVFRRRIDKFRATNPDFRWKFEGYEMMCCVDAVRIAEHCGAPEGVAGYARLPYERQLEAGIDAGHSGNSFSFAVRLAHHYLSHPELVVREHGALTPLVGCGEYGCPHQEETP